MDIDYIWEVISPWVAIIGSILGVILTILSVAVPLIKKLFKKNDTLLESKVDKISTDDIARRTAEHLAGKTIDIDVTAVTEKSLRKLNKQLDKRIEKVEETVASLSVILVPMGKGISKLKALTDDERAELTAAIQKIENGYTPPEEDKKMTVVLTPVELPEEDEETDDEDDGEEETGLNFGGLED